MRRVIDLCLDMPMGAEALTNMLGAMCLDPLYRGYKKTYGAGVAAQVGLTVEEIDAIYESEGRDGFLRIIREAAEKHAVIVGEGFRMHDGDIYYGTVGSWGMSSLRLPMWIGRNKVLDYMFLNEDFTGRQCYELGLASKVVADELVEVVGLATAKKMSKAAPIAVKYYKDCVRKATQNNIEEARAFELKAAEIVFATEDSKIGLKSVVENHGVPNCEFYGR